MEQKLLENKQEPQTSVSPFGTVESTPEETYRQAIKAGQVDPGRDLLEKNSIVAGLAAELKEAQEWEKRAETEYRNAMEKRIECMNVLMRAVQNLLGK